jgi:hypothetical protein
MKTLKLQNTKTKTLQSSQEENQICLPPVKLHTKNLKTPKMIRRKLKTQELPNIKTKNPSKFTRKKVDTPFPPL